MLHSIACTSCSWDRTMLCSSRKCRFLDQHGSPIFCNVAPPTELLVHFGRCNAQSSDRTVEAARGVKCGDAHLPESLTLMPARPTYCSRRKASVCALSTWNGPSGGSM
jgi:hypothetical protein